MSLVLQKVVAGWCDTWREFLGNVEVLRCGKWFKKIQPEGVLDAILPISFTISTPTDVEGFQRGKGEECRMPTEQSHTRKLRIWRNA